MEGKDPIGQAILEFAATGISEDILIESDVIDDDVIPSHLLLRSIDEMPEVEQIAIQRAKGNILDVGAGAGIHASELIKKGHPVKTIDISEGAVEYMLGQGIDAECTNFLSIPNDTKYSTVLMMMNGIGISGTLDGLKQVFKKADSLLLEDGIVLIDSTDIKYIYAEEDGSFWVDLNGSYYGEVKFRMSYKNNVSDWFNWLYIDQKLLKEIAHSIGFETNIIHEDDGHFLAELKRIG